MDLALTLRRCLKLTTPACTTDLIKALESDCLPVKVRLSVADLPLPLLACYGDPLPRPDRDSPASFNLAAGLPIAANRCLFAGALLASASGTRYQAMYRPTAEQTDFSTVWVRRTLQVGYLLWGDEPLHEPELRVPGVLAEWAEVPELFARQWVLHVPWQQAMERAWQRRLVERRTSWEAAST